MRISDWSSDVCSSDLPRHPWRSCSPGSPGSIVLPRKACKPGEPGDRAPGHTPLAPDGPARSPFFCGDFLHHLDLEIPLRHQLLQTRVLSLKLLQPATNGNASCREREIKYV